MENNTKELIQNEIQRIKAGPVENEKPAGMLVRFVVTCNGNAGKVLEKSKQIMCIVDQNSMDQWPSDETWRASLPDWFISRCTPEETQEEAEIRLKKWRKMSHRKQAILAQEKAWPLSSWLYWFEYDNRNWFWWDIAAKDENTILFSVMVFGWPFPWGALRWLFIACGAVKVQEENKPRSNILWHKIQSKKIWGYCLVIGIVSFVLFLISLLVWFLLNLFTQVKLIYVFLYMLLCGLCIALYDVSQNTSKYKNLIKTISFSITVILFIVLVYWICSKLFQGN